MKILSSKKMTAILLTAIMLLTTFSSTFAAVIEVMNVSPYERGDGKKDVSLDTVVSFTYEEWKGYKDKDLKFEVLKLINDEEVSVQSVNLNKEKTVVDAVYAKYTDNITFSALDPAKYILKLSYLGETGREYLDFQEWIDLRSTRNTIDIKINGQALTPISINVFENNEESYGKSYYRRDNPLTVILDPNKSYQYTLALKDFVNDRDYIIRGISVTENDGSLIIEKELTLDDFTKINIENKEPNTPIKAGYYDDRNNYSEIFVDMNSNSVYLEKNKKVFKLTAENNVGPVVLDSKFVPTIESTYTLGFGTSYESKVYDRYLEKDLEIDTLAKLQQGGTYAFSMAFRDNLGNYYDFDSWYMDDYLIKAYIEKDGKEVYRPSRIYHRNGQELYGVDKYIPIYTLQDWYVKEEGAYNLKYIVNGTEMVNESINISVRQEMDIAILDAKGNLITRGYLTEQEAKEGIKIKVTKHVTGEIGKPVEGVVLSERYNDDIHGVTNAEGIVELKDLRRYNYKLEKEGYITKYLYLPIIYQGESLAKIKALDKNGNPLTNARVMLTIERDGKKEYISQYISDGNEFAEMIVPANAKITIDFGKRTDHNSPGYYIIGSFISEANKLHEIVLDSREPIYKVSKVTVGENILRINILRDGFVGDISREYVYDRYTGMDYFYASNGTYTAGVLYDRDTNYGLETLVISGDKTYQPTFNAANGVRLKSDYAIEEMNHLVDPHTILQMWGYKTNYMNLLPANYRISVSNIIEGDKYYYTKTVNKEELLNKKEFSIGKPGVINGLDFVYKNSNGNPLIVGNRIEIGLSTDNGYNVSRINKVIPHSTGYSEYEKYYPTKFKLTDANGRIINWTGESTEMTYYPFNLRLPASGKYTLELTTTINGISYSLNKTFEAIGITKGAEQPVIPKPVEPSYPEDNDSGYRPPSNNTTEDSKNQPKEESIKNTVKDIVNDNTKTESEKVELVTKSIEEISKVSLTIKDSKEAEKAISDFSNVLKDTSKLLENIVDEKEKEKALEAVNTIIKTTQLVLEKVEDGNKSVSLTKNIIKDLGKVLKETNQSSKTEEIQKNLLDVSQMAVDKVGKISLGNEAITIEGTSVKAKVDSKDIEKQMKDTKKAQEQLAKELKDALGKDMSNAIKPKMTIDIPKSQDTMNKFSVELPKEIKDSMKQNAISGVKINMDKVAFNIAEDTFGEITDNLTLSSEVVNRLDVNLPSTAEKIATIPVMEFSARIGDEKVKQFSKPLEVSFDASSIDVNKYTAEDLERLTAYKLNESTMQWESVGGVYDPVTKTVKVLRDNFSKYTVAVAKKEYLDVKGNWAEKQINTMLGKGILDDMESFNPSSKVTREEFASWIARVNHLTTLETELPFIDIDESNIYYKDMLAAYSNGVIQGKGNNKFDPKGYITREEMASIISRTLEVEEKLEAEDILLESFTDNDNISSWAKNSVAAVKHKGIIAGYKDGTFKPKSDATKAEAATIIYKIYFNK